MLNISDGDEFLACIHIYICAPALIKARSIAGIMIHQNLKKLQLLKLFTKTKSSGLEPTVYFFLAIKIVSTKISEEKDITSFFSVPLKTTQIR